MNPKKLTPRNNHHHFWIEDNVVYESYSTLRGIRYMPCAEVIYPDSNKLTDEDIGRINLILALNN